MNKQIAEVLYLAMLVQQETDYAVFIRFSGHVKSLHITIVKSKEDWQEHIANSYVYTDQDESEERLQAVKETLLEIIESGEVDTSQMDYEIEEIYHYQF